MMTQDIPIELQNEVEAKRRAKEEDDLIREEQEVAAACLEMHRIVDDIIVPQSVEAAYHFKGDDLGAEVVIMDTESPVDGDIYYVGARFRFGDRSHPSRITLLADPTKYVFVLTGEHDGEEVFEETVKFHEVTPRYLQRVYRAFFLEHFPDVEYQPKRDVDADRLDKLKAPFSVKMDDNGEVNELVSAKTLDEAVHMGATFCKTFKTEEKITIVDANGEVIC